MAAGTTEPSPEEILPEDLEGLFAIPQWLRDLGLGAWLLVGVTLLLAGGVWLLALTQTIVLPVLTASIIAAVLSPVMGLLHRHGVPRGAGAALVMLTAIVAALLVAFLIVAGITDQAKALTGNLTSAADKLRGYLQDAGVSADAAQNAESDASGSLSSAFHALLDGLGVGIRALGGLAVFLSFTALSLFFLLKDGPSVRAWAERHAGLPRPVAHAIAGRTLQSLRNYFGGVTIVAAFNAVLIGLGALVLDVPHAGAIALVNFVAAYVPYLGAWSAGAFTVLVALGAQGPDTAIAMAVVSLLANGPLQQLVQPIAFGATLDMHPLAILIVTIGAGSLFGTIGLVLAAPLTSAALRVSGDLARARARGST